MPAEVIPYGLHDAGTIETEPLAISGTVGRLTFDVDPDVLAEVSPRLLLEITVQVRAPGGVWRSWMTCGWSSGDSSLPFIEKETLRIGAEVRAIVQVLEAFTFGASAGFPD